jgi:glycosyltransferase involved in cell wall biosynthesis
MLGRLAAETADYEIIVVDGGSTDATGEIAHSYSLCSGRFSA